MRAPLSIGRRHAATYAALAAACCFSPTQKSSALDVRKFEVPDSVPQPLLDLKKAIDDDAALEEKLRKEAVQPNKFGRLDAPPPPPPPPKYEAPGFNGQRGLDTFGRLAPEYEGDERERYSNPYAGRLAETNKERPKLLNPQAPTSEVDILFDPYNKKLSVKPKNMQCDEDGRNCKFTGRSPNAADPTRGYTPIPYEETAEYRRDQLKAENARKRELNAMKARGEPLPPPPPPPPPPIPPSQRGPTVRADVLGGGYREDDNTRRSIQKADALRAERAAENARIREANLAKAKAKAEAAAPAQ